MTARKDDEMERIEDELATGVIYLVLHQLLKHSLAHSHVDSRQSKHSQHVQMS